jgi:hypothetical protein
VLGSDGYYLFVMCNQTLVASSSFYDHITRHIISFKEGRRRNRIQKNHTTSQKRHKKKKKLSLLWQICYKFITWDIWIRGVVLNWFKTYISNRKQKVKITSQNCKQDSSCRWETIKNGVPQGLILGPLLFIIYVNDLPRGVNQFANPVIFADEHKCVILC